MNHSPSRSHCSWNLCLIIMITERRILIHQNETSFRRISSDWSPFLCSKCNIAPIISSVKRCVLIFLWTFCERYKPSTFTWKSHLSSLLDKDGSFMEMYRATARQRGKSFPSCAWRMPLLHRDFSLTFALDFLDLTTFLPQILGKIYSSDFLTTFYDNDLWFIPQQVRFLAGSF